MFQQIDQDQANNKFFCEEHPENKLQVIYLGDQLKIRSRLLCMSCIVNFINLGQNDKLKPIVQIKDFIQNPTEILKNLPINEKNGQKVGELNHQKINKLIDEFEKNIKNYANVIRQNIQEPKAIQNLIGKEIEEQIKIKDIQAQFHLVQMMDSHQGTKEFKVLEDQLNFIGQNIQKILLNANQKTKQYQQKTVQNIQTCIDQIKLELDHMQKCINKQLNNEVNEQKIEEPIKQDVKPAIISDLKKFPLVHQQISQGRQIQYQLLYTGSVDGLTPQAFWQKCNLQSNLLTIMVSKNSNKFGGFSPCQINKNLNNFVEDKTLRSFIYQYNKKEIYTLKNQARALYCQQEFGPCYGEDLLIKNNFLEGISNIGTSYDIKEKNIKDSLTHLFGGHQSQLTELKVYKIIYL